MTSDLGQAYLDAGRRQDAISMIEAELKKKPLKASRAQILVRLLQRLAMHPAALDVARLAEFTSQHETSANDRSSRQLAAVLVDGELRQMGLFKELRERLETRRALGEELRAIDYQWLGTIYQGTDAVTILREGIKKRPDSVGLRSDLMQLLEKLGQKAEALKAYEDARDLYFAKMAKYAAPAPSGSLLEESDSLSPVLVATRWYAFLLREGRDAEFRRLDLRFQEVCPTLLTDPKDMMLPRAHAEFMAGRHAAAAKSLETCRERKLGGEALTTALLAHSLRAVGRREDAIKWYRRAVQLSDVEPRLLSEFLCLVAEEYGAAGVSHELPVYQQAALRQNVRLNATLTCFAAWAALGRGDQKAAIEQLVAAGPYLNMAAGTDPSFDGDEGLACGVICHVVAEKLRDSQRLAGAAKFLEHFAAERVKAMRKVFSLEEPK